MKTQNTNLLIVAALALMTNGLSLLGLNHGSAGALARNIECNSSMSRNIRVAASREQLIGSPPCPTNKSSTARFSLD